MAKKAKKKATVKKKAGKKIVKKAAKKTAKKAAKKTPKKAAKKAVKKAPVKKKKTAKKATTKVVAKKTAKTAKKTTKAKPAKPAVKKIETKKVKTKTKAKPTTETNSLSIGDPAPDFNMETDTHGKISLGDYLGKSHVLLYFYPKDDTPGCTVQACTFQESEHHYNDANVTVIGVSPDNIASHQKFRSKYSLGFTLASDPDHAVAESYGVWVLKNNYGKEYMGIQRATFLINKDGKIAAIWPKVKVEGHDAEVQAAIAQLT